MMQKNLKSKVLERRSHEPGIKIFWVILFLILAFTHFPAHAQNNDFTIIVLPDTQWYSCGNSQVLVDQLKWIVQNRNDLNIVYVAHVGDVVECGNKITEGICLDRGWCNSPDEPHPNVAEREWMVAQEIFEDYIENDAYNYSPGYPSDGIPYGLAIGNHDQFPHYCAIDPVDGSNSTTKSYNDYFGVTKFEGRSYYGGHYGDNNDNHYDLFSAGGVDFIVIYLEYYKTTKTPEYDYEAVLAWASNILKRYGNRKGIVVYHYLINRLDDNACCEGETTGGTGGIPGWAVQEQGGEKIYTELKTNPNLFLMLCGHVDGKAIQCNGVEEYCDAEAYRIDPVYCQVNGQSIETGHVYTVLANYQKRYELDHDDRGWLRIMTFKPSQNKISVQTYSPSRNEYETDWNSDFDLEDYTIHYDPTVKLISPNGGENWGVGSSHNITWASTGTVGNVTIAYSTDNGSSWTEIISSTANDGSYNWTVPNNPSNNCLVQVSETDGNPSDISNAVFSISVLQDIDPPFGTFETPVDNTTVFSSIPVTGWALDDVEVESVKIYREEGSNLVFIGDAVFVEGARPDVEAAYPGYPNNSRAGWGYMMLTNFLPNGGNGTFTLHAVAKDTSGKTTTLGTKTITCDNANAVKPFGAIDTPTQGGTASGSNFVVWGWALTPPPNLIPTDGSTISVWVDGINVGHPTYNIFKENIAALFPGYANSNGAGGYFYLDTTTYADGVHTICWTATDNAGNADGIGSRYFTINNSQLRRPASLTGPMPGTKLSDSSETFGWSAGSDVSAYKIDVGTSPGGSNIHDGSSTTQHWQGVSNLPTNGETIYVRLSSQIDGNWVSNDYAYEAAGNPVAQQPEISLNKSTISRSVIEGQNLSGDTFQVRNSGIGTLDYSISDNKTWLSVSPTGGSSTGEWDTINVNYSTTSLTVGTYTAVITVSAPNTDAKTLTVSLAVNDANSPITFQRIGEMAGGDPRTRIWGRRGITNTDISGGPIAVGRGSDGGEGNGFTAFRWQNSAFVGLPRTGSTPYSSNSWGYGISADGSVVYGGDFDNDTTSRAVVWTNTGSGWANANKIVLNGSSGWGALSANGTAIVDYSNDAAYKFTTADNWATAGGVSRTTLTGMTKAEGCSSDGSIVVGTDASGPAIFNGPNGAHTKVSLPGSGTCYAVSDDGTVVAGISPTNTYGKDEPCKWVYADGTWEKTILPLLPGMVPESNKNTGSAFMVSADGSRIAGQFREYGDYYIPLIWENGGVQKLEDILNSAGVYLEPGWYLADLGAMSPDGKTFGGSMSDQPYGSADNNRHAWIAKIDDSGDAVLFDSGFETASGWTFSTLGSFPGTSVFRSNWGTASGHSGSYGLALSNQAYATPITDFIAAGPGSHTISAWVRGEMDESSSGGWLIRAYFYDSNKQALSPAWQNASKCTGSDSCLSTTWTEETGTVDAPAGTAYIKIKLLFHMAGGWVAYDDVSLDGQPLTVAAHGVDGGFETATGWSFDISGSFPGTSVYRSNWGTANKHSGSYALALSNQAYARPVTDFIAAGPGSHTISAWVRGEMEESSAGGWVIRAYFYDSNKQALSPAWQNASKCTGSDSCLSTTWSEKTGTVDAPAGTAYIKIKLLFYMAGGWVAYDDVSLDGQPLTAAVHGVDGGFEATTGWSFDTLGSFPGTSVYRATGGTASGHSGSYALALSNQAYAQPVTDFIAATPGPYTVSAWVRGEMDESSFGGWIIRAFFYDSNKQALSPAWQNATACTGSAGCLSTTWTEKTGTVDAPAGTAYIKLRLYFYMAGGWVAYDDVEIVKSN
jgi:hypothetical protein